MSKIRLEIGTNPTNPPANSIYIYPKTDKKLYYKNEDGQEFELGQGLDGQSILNGSNNPPNSLGNDGDFYLNTTNYTLFGPKASGAWPSGVALVNGISQDFFEFNSTDTIPAQPLTDKVKLWFRKTINRFFIQRDDNSLTPIIEINKEEERLQPLPTDEMVVWCTIEQNYKKVKATNGIPIALQQRYVSFDEDDFLATVSSSKLNWSVTSSGSGASAQAGTYGVNGTDCAVGVMQLDTGTTNAGRVTYARSQNALQLGYAKFSQTWRVAVEDLSTALERFVFRCGFFDTNTNVEATDGVYFRYSDDANSGQWQCYARSGGINETIVNTNVAVDTSYNILRIDINEDATEALFYINDNLVATITSAIPSNQGDFTGIAIQLAKTVGVTQRAVSIDYFSQKVELTGGRQ